MRQDVFDVLTLEGQGFFEYLDQLVSPTGDYGGDPYDNTGTGYVVGGELLARLDTEWVDGWLSCTLMRSRRVDRPGERERAFSYDQTHVLAVVLGVNLPYGFRIGGRFRYATGNPYTPLAAAYHDAEADTCVPGAAGPLLSGRIDDFFQLDLRVDKTSVFDGWTLDIYLELNNATNQANTEAVSYAFDHRARSDTTSPPIQPSLGIRGSS